MENLTLEQRAKEILVANDLDFTIHKVRMMGEYIRTSNIGGVDFPVVEMVQSPYYGLLNSKTNEIINTVKEGYTVSQNLEVVMLALKGSENFGEIEVSNAGSLNGGRKTFIQLRISGRAKVGGDELKRYVTIIDSNDGTSGLSVGIGNLTMSCQNQFFQFYKAGQMKARHTVSLEAKIKEIPYLIKEALDQDLRLMELFNEFQSTACSRNLANKMVNEIIGFDRTTDQVTLDEKSSRSVNQMNELYDNIEHEMNSKGDNFWGLFSGVTRWTTHSKSAPKRTNGRLESVMVGTNYKTNQKALEVTERLLAEA